jgi:hypothetical protein
MAFENCQAEISCVRKWCAAALEKQNHVLQKTDDFETHQTVGFGTHLTVDGDARLITRPA